MSQISYYTQEGYDKLVAELDRLKTDERQKIAKAIGEAREKGDLSENAEYDAAKDAQGLLEMKINELEKVYANARIIDASQLDSSKITVLSNVELKNVKTGKEIKYQLVAESEANIKLKKISVGSPIGKGLLGKAVGEIAVISTPNGDMQLEVISITL